jgi:phosphatidate cytidylyltransferase
MLMRFISGLIGIPLLILLVYTGEGIPFVLGVGVISVIALLEFNRGVRRIGADPQDWLGLASVLLFLFSAQHGFKAERFSLSGVLTVFVIAALVVELLRPHRSPIKNLGSTFLGVVYVGWLFSYLIAINSIPGRFHLAGSTHTVRGGAWLVLYITFVAWASDTGAYLIGRKWGTHKLVPHLSPGKSWEGLIAGIGSAIVMSIIMGKPIGMSWISAIMLGIGIAIAGVVGDLAESAMKRDIGIKDFGSIMPGHGGILDRFDSLLFAAPLFYYYITLFLGY